MKINVKRIPVDGESLSGSEPASIMELDEPDVARDPVRYLVRYDRGGCPHLPPPRAAIVVQAA